MSAIYSLLLNSSGNRLLHGGNAIGENMQSRVAGGRNVEQGYEGSRMIELIRELINLLSQDHLTIEAITSRVGAMVRDPGGLLPMELQSQLPGVSSAQLVRYPDSGRPYLLDLELNADARPVLKSLKVLGDYQKSITHRNRPREVLFYTTPEKTQWRVVLIAELEEGSNGLDDAKISRLVFRRDPVEP